MRSFRLPVAFALLLAGIAGCSRDPSAQPSPSASASPAEAPKTATRPTTSAQAERSGPPVVIAIDNVSATRGEGGLLITCEATLFNRTGAPLPVTTNFSSPFDGLEIVVRSEEGRELARQAYIHHQSPSAEDQRIPVAPGPTTQTLRFPIAELNDVSGTVHVKLAGGLPGTGIRGGLLSNEVDVVIGNEKGAP